MINSFIPGHGTTNEPQYHENVDAAVPSGSWFYRLRQVDLDGSEFLTEHVRVDVLTHTGELAPMAFQLLQNHLNPFNPSTAIKFSVEMTGRATVTVYNLLGQPVATLFSGAASEGQYYTVILDASMLPSGMYLYNLESGNRTALKKLPLLR